MGEKRRVWTEWGLGWWGIGGKFEGGAGPDGAVASEGVYPRRRVHRGAMSGLLLTVDESLSPESDQRRILVV